MSLLREFSRVRPSGIIPYAAAWCVVGPGARCLRPGRALVLQPHDAAILGDDLSAHLPSSLQLLHLADISLAARVEVPFRAGRLSFPVGLHGFSAILALSWGRQPDLSVWLVEPDFSEAPPHLGLAVPHLEAVLRELS